MPGKTFPTVDISAQSIRNVLAENNTAGTQINVALNDFPVRMAANAPAGTISYNNLQGTNVLWSGFITVGYYDSSPNFFYGYAVNLFGNIQVGSLNTTSYYSIPTSTAGVATPIRFFYTTYNSGLNEWTFDISFQTSKGSPTIFSSRQTVLTTTINGTRRTYTYPNRDRQGAWQIAPQTNPIVPELSSALGSQIYVLITY